MNISKIISLLVLLFSSIVSAFSYHLYSDIPAKYANIRTGKVGWVSLGEIEQKKVDTLRKDLFKSVDEQVTYHNNKLSSLSELKSKINNATNQEELRRYCYPYNARGMVLFFNS